MILTDELKENLLRLKQEKERLKGFVNFEIFGLDDIEKGQVGYSVDTEGNSLVSNEEGAWKEEWIVIGYETLCGDPIITDTSEVGLPVSSLMHGMGDWSGGSYISKSLKNFTCAIEAINHFTYEKSAATTVPAITCEELDHLIDNIIKEDEYGDADTWKGMLSLMYESTEEYENLLAKKVSEMTASGMKIKEISEELNMSLKDAYHYSKRKNKEDFYV